MPLEQLTAKERKDRVLKVSICALYQSVCKKNMGIGVSKAECNKCRDEWLKGEEGVSIKLMKEDI